MKTGKNWDYQWNKINIETPYHMPWESNEPDLSLVNFINKNKIKTAIDVGCALGTNANWMQNQGIETDAIDVSPKIISYAKEKFKDVNFMIGDFLYNPIIQTNYYDLVFDRGCFHGFDNREESFSFVNRVSQILSPQGKWLSIIGADRGLKIKNSPPIKKASEIISIVEPVMEIVSLESCFIKMFDGYCFPAWALIAQNML
jgi:SAM-dependent methyltransferase